MTIVLREQTRRMSSSEECWVPQAVRATKVLEAARGWVDTETRKWIKGIADAIVESDKEFPQSYCPRHLKISKQKLVVERAAIEFQKAGYIALAGLGFDNTWMLTLKLPQTSGSEEVKQSTTPQSGKDVPAVGSSISEPPAYEPEPDAKRPKKETLKQIDSPCYDEFR